MNEPLSRRLMDLPPEARPGFTMPHSPPQRGDEHLPAREHETGILWHYRGPVPSTFHTRAVYAWCWLPDLDDAGSWGPLLKCARQVHQAPRLGVHWFEGDDDDPSPFKEPGWIVDLGDGENVVCGATEYEEALVCAIEDAAAQEHPPAHCGACGQEHTPPPEGSPTCPICARDEWILSVGCRTTRSSPG